MPGGRQSKDRQRQLVYVLAGLLAAAGGLAVPTRIWDKYSIFLMARAFLLLLVGLGPGIGHEVNGSRRWVRLGLMNFQVSELARVMILTWVASYAVRRSEELATSFKGFLKPVGVLAAAAVLLLAEPDFGAATVLMATGLGVLILAGVRLHHFVVPMLAGVGAMALLAVSSDYRMRRLTAFRNPWADEFDSGYQLTPSLIAIGRGDAVQIVAQSALDCSEKKCCCAHAAPVLKSRRKQGPLIHPGGPHGRTGDHLREARLTVQAAGSGSLW